MIGKIFPSNNASFCLDITIKCKGKHKFRAIAHEENRRNSSYADRCIVVENERTIYFSFPTSPPNLFVGVKCLSGLKDEDFKVRFKIKELKTYNIWVDDETTKFLKLASHFSKVCGYETANKDGRLFQTSGEEFKIKYYPVIINHKDNKPMNTPARIGHKSGTIEVAKAKFDKYTIPMRMIILLHEYSHKYKNPQIGLPISDEVGADINALYIYLGLGYSKIDAICVFAKVFLKAQTPGNMERMRKIMDYIQKFENGEFAAKVK
jgi:hypothetical protein